MEPDLAEISYWKGGTRQDGEIPQEAWATWTVHGQKTGDLCEPIWKGFRTLGGSWQDDPPWSHPSHRASADGRTMEQFFQDLGELRGVVELMLALLQELDPKLTTPNLSGSAGTE
jgi:hypothetical protein